MIREKNCFLNSVFLVRVHPWIKEMTMSQSIFKGQQSRGNFLHEGLLSWIPGLFSPGCIGLDLNEAQQSLLPIEETQGEVAQEIPPSPWGLPQAQPLFNCPFPRKGGREDQLHHLPGSNLTTKRQRIKAARRLFLKGREKKWLTVESQSRRSNISSDRNLWEKEPGQGDRA